MTFQKPVSSLDEDLQALGLTQGRVLNLAGPISNREFSDERTTLSENVVEQDRLDLHFANLSDASRAEDLVRGVAPYSSSADGLTLTIEQGVPVAHKQRALDVLEGANLPYEIEVVASAPAERMGDPERIRELWGNISLDELDESQIDALHVEGVIVLEALDPLSEHYEAIYDVVYEIEEAKRVRRRRSRRGGRKVKRGGVEVTVGGRLGPARATKRTSAKDRMKSRRYRKSAKGKRAKRKYKRARKGIGSSTEESHVASSLRSAMLENSDEAPFAAQGDRMLRVLDLVEDEFYGDEDAAGLIEDLRDRTAAAVQTSETEREFAEAMRPVLSALKRSVEIIESVD